MKLIAGYSLLNGIHFGHRINKSYIFDVAKS